MADGRMLRRTLAWDARFAQLSEQAGLLYLMAIPHLDVDGRMLGHPAAVRGTVAPMLAERHGWTDGDVEGWIGEWQSTRDEDGHHCPLVWWYGVGGTLVLEFRGFAKNQRLRRDREAASLFPPPPHDLLSEHVLEPAPVPSGAAAATPPQEPLESAPVPSGGAAATQPQGRPGQQPSTNGRGYSGVTPELLRSEAEAEVEVESKQQLPRGPDSGDDVALLLAARFTSLFDRPHRLRDDLRPRLERAVAAIGIDGAVRLMEERAAQQGATPGSLAFFLPAFEERAGQLPQRRESIDGSGNGWRARAERYVDQVGFQLTDGALREELAERFRHADDGALDELCARAAALRPAWDTDEERVS